MDADAEQSLGSRYKVTGFPTLKIFKDGKPQDYNGARDAAGMADALLRAGGADKETKNAVKAKLGGGGGGGKAGKGGKDGGGKGGGGKGGGGGGDKPKWADDPEIVGIMQEPKVKKLLDGMTDEAGAQKAMTVIQADPDLTAKFQKLQAGGVFGDQDGGGGGGGGGAGVSQFN